MSEHLNSKAMWQENTLPASKPGGGALSDLATDGPPTRKAFGEPKFIYAHAFLESG